MNKNSFIREIKLISKFMMSQPGKETIAMHKLTSISRSKGNQAIKFGFEKGNIEKPVVYPEVNLGTPQV